MFGDVGDFASFVLPYVLSFVSILVLLRWLYLRVQWVRAVNRLPTLHAEKSSLWLSDLADILGAPLVPGTRHPDVLPLLLRHMVALSARGHGLSLLWIFNPLRLPFARPMVVLWDPALIHEILAPGNYCRFQKGSSFRVAEQLLGSGLQSIEDGPAWTCQRHLAQPGFGPKVLDAAVGCICKILDRLFVRWDHAASKGDSVEVNGPMTHVLLDALGKVAFDFEFGSIEESADVPLCSAFECIQDMLAERALSAPWVRSLIGRRCFKKAIAQLERVVDDIKQCRLQARKDGVKHSDLLEHLLWTETGQNGPQSLLSPKAIMDNMKTFLFAGHGTTASSLTWSLWLLAVHRSVQCRLQEEVDALLAQLGAKGETLDCAVLRKLPFLDAVIKETLRLYPPMFFSRAPVADVELGHGRRVRSSSYYVVPKGCDIYVFPYLVHRHPDHWERAEEFVPDRWLEGGGCKTGGPCTYIPFGFGRRGCIGQELALTEIRAALVRVVSRYELLPDAYAAEPTVVLRATLGPTPVRVKLVRRKPVK